MLYNANFVSAATSVVNPVAVTVIVSDNASVDASVCFVVTSNVASQFLDDVIIDVVWLKNKVYLAQEAQNNIL